MKSKHWDLALWRPLYAFCALRHGLMSLPVYLGWRPGVEGSALQLQTCRFIRFLQASLLGIALISRPRVCCKATNNIAKESESTATNVWKTPSRSHFVKAMTFQHGNCGTLCPSFPQIDAQQQRIVYDVVVPQEGALVGEGKEFTDVETHESGPPWWPGARRSPHSGRHGCSVKDPAICHAAQTPEDRAAHMMPKLSLIRLFSSLCGFSFMCRASV